MIPDATLSDEIFGNGLRDRVSACRKRVRRHRAQHTSVTVGNASGDVFPEPGPAVDHVRQYTEEQSTVAGSLTEEQEVGIT